MTSQRKNIEISSFWLTRIIFLRSLAFVYTIAFLVSKLQNKQLIGYNGLTPADLHLSKIKQHLQLSDPLQLFLNLPTVLWFVDYADHGRIDFFLDGLSWLGITLSSFVLITGKANMIIMFVLWLSYHSIVNVGQNWFSFGWESQLLETGFLGIFMCSFLSLKMIGDDHRPSFIPIFLCRWLIFRIMIGAGMIKLRGDRCWWDLTCMDYHYETQPVPNPLSYFLHQQPFFMHRYETLVNHVVELVAPWLLLLPQPCAKIGGVIQIMFQCILIISGNLSFLNWLTILPSICCFEDRDLQLLFSEKTQLKIIHLVTEDQSSKNSDSTLLKLSKKISRNIRKIVDSGFLVVVGLLSLAVVQNILSPRQIMNTSFDTFRIVNTYGAFGSVTKQRTEVVIEGTESVSPYAKDAIWLEYEFNCKPGNLFRRPCLISPYHYRLDWLMWFAAFQNANDNVWLYHLLYKLLKNDPIADDLIAINPFKHKSPPKFIRALHYKYKFKQIGNKDYNSSQWWQRSRINYYIRPLNKDALRELAAKFHWIR